MAYYREKLLQKPSQAGPIYPYDMKPRTQYITVYMTTKITSVESNKTYICPQAYKVNKFGNTQPQTQYICNVFPSSRAYLDAFFPLGPSCV